MKKKSLTNSILFLINVILAVVLLLSYLLPFLSPKNTPTLAILSLLVPVFYILNIVFLVFWLVKLKKKLFVSALAIVLGIGYVSSMYKFSGKEVLQNSDLKVMSYNVKMFNHYGWNSNDSTAYMMYDFIKKQNPDILTLQEFYHGENVQINYPHKYIKTKTRTNKFGLATYSKFPIIHSGSLDLENTSNNIIFTDIVKNSDTIRVYNIHLESMGIKPEKDNFGEENSDKLISRMKLAFKKQVSQVEKFLEHQKQWNGKVLVCGDFNNTAFSWVFRQIAKGKQDAFVKAGKGFGKTFDYTYPIRIDFILPDASFEINYFKTFKVKYSDHFPILTRLQLKEN